MSIQGNWDRRELSRRRFLGWAGLGAGGLAVAASGFSDHKAWAKPFFHQDPFSLGVASGDPRSDGVVLWTRLAPEPLADDGSGGMPGRKVPVRWEVATDERFSNTVVKRGNTFATPELAHSVHVEVDGLLPGREYFYRFKAGPETSPVGRTKTAPAFGAVGQMAFAFASCQSYTSGYYTAYRNMVDEDLDLVVHLGDYIYEGAGPPPGREAPGRAHAPAREIRSLADYRIRHAQYRTDTDLQAAHETFPFVVTWDDHEVENNWADEDSDPDTDPQDFLRRRARAFQAYYEHMPLRRPQRPVGPDLLLYRGLTFGNLLRFNVLDTRQYRSDQPPDRDAEGPVAFDPSRTMLGDEQERWLFDALNRSPARWNVLAQQVPVYEDAAVGAPNDKWEGYRASRERLIDFLAQREPANPVVITGDVHFNSVADLKADFEDPDSETVASEFVGTSISTGGDGTPRSEYEPDPANPHIKWENRGQRGYVRCTVDQTQWRTDYRIVETVESQRSGIETVASFVVEDGRRGVQQV
ncbi:MAG: alkaline phosphatase D family protein [Actinomycetota bacterium]|nr:alkaline phosphatase D family protein [Actinomycetota bacterium]